jgi:hypothetical protein
MTTYSVLATRAMDRYESEVRRIESARHLAILSAEADHALRVVQVEKAWADIMDAGPGNHKSADDVVTTAYWRTVALSAEWGQHRKVLAQIETDSKDELCQAWTGLKRGTRFPPRRVQPAPAGAHELIPLRDGGTAQWWDNSYYVIEIADGLRRLVHRKNIEDWT